MAKESLQKKLDRVRPPRVQIKYEVYIGGAMEMKELPFVVGVLGDFSGKADPNTPAPQLKERKFVEIDRDNFSKVLKAQGPRLAYPVDDALSGQADQRLNVELKFSSMDDFSPENVAKQIPLLRALLEQRDALKDLSSRMQSSERLGDLLGEILSDSEKRDVLAKELGNNSKSPSKG